MSQPARSPSLVASLAAIAFAAAAPRAHAAPANVEKFIEDHVEDARHVNARWGLPTSLVLAISGLESGWGKVTHGGNSYFGVTTPCGSVTDPASVSRVQTTVNGKAVTLCFVKYASYREAALGMAKNLCNKTIYASAVSYAESHHDEPSGFDVSVFIDRYAPIYCPGCTAYPATVKSARAWTARTDSEPLPVCRYSADPSAAAADPAEGSDPTPPAKADDKADAKADDDKGQPPAGDPDTSE
jgi:hypothetical protein